MELQSLGVFFHDDFAEVAADHFLVHLFGEVCLVVGHGNWDGVAYHASLRVGWWGGFNGFETLVALRLSVFLVLDSAFKASFASHFQVRFQGLEVIADNCPTEGAPENSTLHSSLD